MAKLTDILDIEKKRPSPEHLRQVRLWADGSFYRAYEWSAWLCVRYIRQFKVTRRFIKNANSDIVFIGFPQSSLEKFCPEDSHCTVLDDKNVLLSLPEDLVTVEEGHTLEKDFENWRTTIPEAETKEKASDSKTPKISTASPVSMTGVMKQIMEFPIESNTPIDCMLFLADVKKHLSSLL